VLDRTELIALWLLPAAPACEFFQSLVGELAGRFDAPTFEPHVTLLGGIANHDRTLQVFRKLLVPTRCELEIEGIHFSELYTKTLFVRFHLSDELRQLRGALAQSFESESGDDFDPHLSLLYKKMPHREQAELARSVKIPFPRATFEGMKLIAYPPKVTTRADVAAWREIS